MYLGIGWWKEGLGVGLSVDSVVVCVGGVKRTPPLDLLAGFFLIIFFTFRGTDAGFVTRGLEGLGEGEEEGEDDGCMVASMAILADMGG